MSEQKTQLQRAFEKLQGACPNEWIICQQKVVIEDLQAENERLKNPEVNAQS